MTRSEAPTAVEQGQQAGSTATPANEAATPETAANTAETAKPLTAAELAALAAAASEDAVPQVESEEAPVEMADAAQAQAKAQAVVDEDEKEDEDDADAQDAPVDLAMGSEAAVFEAIAAADDARAAPGDEGEEASALGGDSNGAPILAVAAVAAAGLGLYAVLDDNDDDIDLPEPEPENVAPVFTSGTDVDFAENTDAGEVVYTATATDADGDDITYSIDADSADFDAFTIDPDTGEVRFVASPDFEMQDSYTLTVIATDSEGNSVSQDVDIAITDVVENTAPTFANGDDVTVAIDENSDVATVVYDANAVDAEGDAITYSIEDGDDSDAFTIDADDGEVRFVASPDFEMQDSYTITVTATDAEGNMTSQDVTIDVNDLDDAITTVNLDAVDTDNNPNTPNLIDSGDMDYLLTDDAEVASYTIIRNFEEGDMIEFSNTDSVSFSTGPDDANDLQIIFNNNGTVSEIILDDVLGDDAGLIFNEATAEAAVGFDFFSYADVTVAADTIA
ncbi:cadherin repeat domain-containing protein [Croceicoccus sp. YJ47]|uniref:cadherin repeat domain-containing protein n=1 Tax=Croceicoccus sp. YJ47 TaxID=2798724 RepID=UPI0019238AA0|nr:cadherin repeat domain-containing protein [Croceicoccus sp. YJ47]QQN75456.1 cadherin repeat domain-containing protein [Croceicoccus sp. YJ47]